MTSSKTKTESNMDVGGVDSTDTLPGFLDLMTGLTWKWKKRFARPLGRPWSRQDIRAAVPAWLVVSLLAVYSEDRQTAVG